MGNLRRQLENKIVAERYTVVPRGVQYDYRFRLRAETAKSVPKTTMASAARATVSPAPATVTPALSPRGPETTISTAPKTQKHHVKVRTSYRNLPATVPPSYSTRKSIDRLCARAPSPCPPTRRAARTIDTTRSRYTVDGIRLVGSGIRTRYSCMRMAACIWKLV